MNQTIEETLEDREKTHGSFIENARYSQALKAIFEQARKERKDRGQSSLSPIQLEALDMIAVKLARLLTGNPDEPDHFLDIAGYAALACKDLDEAAAIKNMATRLKPNGKEQEKSDA